MCGHTTWVLLDGHSTLQALEGGLEALRTRATRADSSVGIEWTRPNPSMLQHFEQITASLAEPRAVRMRGPDQPCGRPAGTPAGGGGGSAG
jgi:hypothetical protein